MIDFVEKVMEMRRVQKEFFKTRNYAAMQLSKSLEKDIDDRAGKLMIQRVKDFLKARGVSL